LLSSAEAETVREACRDAMNVVLRCVETGEGLSGGGVYVGRAGVALLLARAADCLEGPAAADAARCMPPELAQLGASGVRRRALALLRPPHAPRPGRVTVCEPPQPLLAACAPVASAVPVSPAPPTHA
jgi:hypothetical protein